MLSFSQIATLTTTLTVVLAQDVLWELNDAKATVYYDLTNSLCDSSDGGPFTKDWAETSGINNGIPFCQGQTAKSLSELGTNRIVAMDSSKIIGNPAEWCGKEVEITDASGNTLSIDEGPLFIWDACAACSQATIIDLSAKAFTGLKGGSCAGNNPTGLTVKVLNNNIWEYGSGGSESSSGSSSGSGSQGAAVPSSSTISTATSTGSSGDINLVADTQSSSAATAQPTGTTSGSGCTYGAWQCSGNDLQICNYVSTTSLDWETVSTCATSCSIDGASVDCH